MNSKSRYAFLAAAALLAGCASTQTLSPDLTVAVAAAADAKWVFQAHTTWGKPVRISLSINGESLSSAAEIAPGNIIGAYQGHAIHAQCKTEWVEGATYGTGSCYIYVDDTQAAILVL